MAGKCLGSMPRVSWRMVKLDDRSMDRNGLKNDVVGNEAGRRISRTRRRQTDRTDGTEHEGRLLSEEAPIGSSRRASRSQLLFDGPFPPCSD